MMDDELLEDNSDLLVGEEDPEFDPDLFLWKKSSLVNNEPDFSTGANDIPGSCCGTGGLLCEMRSRIHHLSASRNPPIDKTSKKTQPPNRESYSIWTHICFRNSSWLISPATYFCLTLTLTLTLTHSKPEAFCDSCTCIKNRMNEDRLAIRWSANLPIRESRLRKTR